LIFSTTHGCEAVSNIITIFITKHRKQLQREDDIRCALTPTGPYFDKLVKQTQRHDSHLNL